MNLRSLILFTSIAILVLNSCDKPSAVEQIDTSYLDGLVGDYSIECQVGYLDVNNIYQFVDTTYVGSLTMNNEDVMLLEFIDGSLVEFEFTYNHLVRAQCSTNDYTNFLGNWMVQDNVPTIEINQSFSSCIEGFSGISVEMSLFATKL